ncbi:MAG: tetratricopeptide repeat protein [Nitrospinae bacterium]|nr:tetratricopeptide repeat protein [Nitrospinota bacterium]
MRFIIAVVFVFFITGSCTKRDKELTNKESAEIHFNMGNEYLRVGDDKKAMEEWYKAKELDPANTRYLNNIATIIYNQGKREEALKLWEQLLSSPPTVMEATYAIINIGNYYKDKKEWTKAMEYYERAVKTSPNYFMSYYNIGLLYYEKGDMEKAEANFKKSISLSNKDAHSHYYLGNIYRERGKLDDAFAEWQRATSMYEKFYLPRYEMANYYFMNGKIEDAIKEYKTIINIEPDNPDFASIYANLGFLLIDTNKPDEAEKTFKKGREINKDKEKDFYFLDGLGWLNYKKGNYEESIKILEDAVKNTPPDNIQFLANEHYHIGMVYISIGKKNIARQNLEKAMQLNKDKRFIADIKGILSKLS